MFLIGLVLAGIAWYLVGIKRLLPSQIPSSLIAIIFIVMILNGIYTTLMNYHYWIPSGEGRYLAVYPFEGIASIVAIVTMLVDLFLLPAVAFTFAMRYELKSAKRFALPQEALPSTLVEKRFAPPPVYLSKTLPAKPRVPKDKKLPKVKTTPLEGLMPLDEKVYLYIADHGGQISWSQASQELGVSIEELKASVERLKQAKRIE